VSRLKSIKKIIAKTRKRWIVKPDKRKAARFWGRQHSDPCKERAFWLGVDEIMSWVNLKVSRQPEIWPLSWFLLSLPTDQLPVRYALSIGCGPGNLEREVIRHRAALKVTGIDISAESLEIAQKLAGDAGYDKQLVYRESDAESWLASEENEPCIDLLFFHASLHHIRALEEVLHLCAERLRRGSPGLLYVDEYVGPSRNEWNPTHLREASALFRRIPVEYRQSINLQPPVAYEDPTEMIRSSEIEEILRREFEILEYKPYYGNVLMPLVCGIRGHGLNDPEVRAILSEAMQVEDDLARKKLLDPLYAVFVGRPRRSP
jgi:SAM-dependent methyltransferase